MNVFLGIIGAVVGFTAGIFLMEVLGFDNRHDPIMSGLLALFVFGPAGAIGGVYLFIRLAMRVRGQTAAVASATGQPATTEAQAGGAAAMPAADTPKPPGVARTGLKAIGIVLALVVVVGGGFAWYEYSTATPWLRPGGVSMQFEIRLAEGVGIPASPQDLSVLLSADVPNVNFLPLPAKLYRDHFRRDGGRDVIVGEVDLAFRTVHRQIDLTIKGRPERTYRISLPGNAPHSRELGPWQKHPDGSEIRYRARWPGED
jgi:hypothetical protein